MPDAAFEKDRGSSEIANFVGEPVHEFGLCVRPTVGKDSFEVVPDALVGVQLGSIRRERHQMQATCADKEFMDGIAPMDLAVVQEHDQMSPDLTQQMAQETGDLFAVDSILVELTVQRTAETPRTDRDSGNGRNPVVLFAVTNDRGLTDRAPGPANRGNQEETGFVDKDDMGCQPCGVFFTAGQTDRFHSAMATSLRSNARRSGFWWLHPSWWRSLPT